MRARRKLSAPVRGELHRVSDRHALPIPVRRRLSASRQQSAQLSTPVPLGRPESHVQRYKKGMIFPSFCTYRGINGNAISYGSCEVRTFAANRQRQHHSGDLHRPDKGTLCYQLHDRLQRGLCFGRTHRQIVHRTHRNLVPASQRQSLRGLISKSILFARET